MWIDEFIIITSNTDAFSIEFRIESIYILRMGFFAFAFAFAFPGCCHKLTYYENPTHAHTKQFSFALRVWEKKAIAIILYKRLSNSGSDPLSGLFCCHWHRHFGYNFGQHHKISLRSHSIWPSKGKAVSVSQLAKRNCQVCQNISVHWVRVHNWCIVYSVNYIGMSVVGWLLGCIHLHSNNASDANFSNFQPIYFIRFRNTLELAREICALSPKQYESKRISMYFN